ncbi:MAG TPA: hypothetical protein VJ974_01175, partial [Geopsychrobacteraceae bacterium]|nr:hypothetical protein [Geopsychrobacteraceae bacterium]
YVKGVALVIVVSLIVGGLNVLKGNDAHEEYTKAYIQALYGVTSGADYSLKKLTQISSGKPLTEQDTQQLNRMKATIEKKRLKLSPSPEQFTISLENLDGIYKAYSDLHSLTVSTVVVSSSFNEKVESLTTNLYQAEQKLKGDLPSALRQNIEVASKRYKSLDFISK